MADLWRASLFLKGHEISPTFVGDAGSWGDALVQYRELFLNPDSYNVPGSGDCECDEDVMNGGESCVPCDVENDLRSFLREHGPDESAEPREYRLRWSPWHSMGPYVFSLTQVDA